jgi:hypothetical protein
MQIALRWFGLAGNPSIGPMRLAAVMIVLGAVLLAASGKNAIGLIGAALWVVGAVIALCGWVRLMHLRAKSN